jgi:hypothetical protein
MPGEYDEADLALLTPEERAILQGDDDDDTDTLQHIADGGGDDDGDDDGADADTSGAASGEESSTPSDDSGTGADAGKPSDSPKPEDPPKQEAKAATYQAQAPADLADQIKALNKEKAELFRKFSDGDLTADEYSEQEQAILDRRDELTRAKTKAEVSAEMAEQAAGQQYSSTLHAFFAEQKRAGFDYMAPDNAEALKMLDARVRALGTLHDDNPEGWKALFNESHSAVAAKFSIKPAAAPAADPGNKKRDRTPDLSNVPPVVGRAPAAADPGVQGDEFAHLNSLDGIALEKAVARMSQEQQERYLSS